MGIYTSHANALREILELKREPVATKFLKNIEELPSLEGYERQRKMRYCQALMLAGQGHKSILSADNIACAAAGAAFGLMPLHPKLASGEGHFNAGVFGSVATAGKIMREMPRLDAATFSYVAVAPLAEIDWVPDVVIIEAPPEALMWICLAEIFNSGERLQFSTSVVQACCVDATVVPFLTGKANGSFGCTGCREASDIEPTEGMLGFPGRDLEEIVSNLKILAEKTIPKNRSKPIAKRFLEK